MEEYKEERADLELFSQKVRQLREEISKVIVGQQEAVALLLTAILADGHVLIEGVPGVAKDLISTTNVSLDRCPFQPYSIHARPHAK